MYEYDKRSSQISSKLRIIYIYIYSNIEGYPLSRDLHFNCRHFTSSHLNFTHLHFTTLHYLLSWLSPFEIPTAPFHLTSHHYISPHLTSLHFQTILATLLFLSFQRESSILRVMVQCHNQIRNHV
jgi:hypothetical protein